MNTSRHTRLRVASVLLGALVLLFVVLLVVVNIVIPRLEEPRSQFSQNDLPSPSSWDDSCFSSTQHPVAEASNGRVRGGRLSFPLVAGFGPPKVERNLHWFSEARSQTELRDAGEWSSVLAVGEVSVGPLFRSPKEAALSSVKCVLGTTWYKHYSPIVRAEIRNESISVDGHPGWIVSKAIAVSDPHSEISGDVVTFLFVEDGRPGRFSGFFAGVPIDDSAKASLVDEVIASLRVN